LACSIDLRDVLLLVVFFSSRSRHTRSKRDWSSDVCSSDLHELWLKKCGPTTLLLKANSKVASRRRTCSTSTYTWCTKWPPRRHLKACGCPDVLCAAPISPLALKTTTCQP